MRTVTGLLVAFMLAAPALASPQAAWVELTGRGAKVRAVTAEPRCPTLNIDGRLHPMSLRAGPTQTFPNRVCQAALPSAARAATLDGQPLPLPKRRPDRIVIFGDTGCRITRVIVQNCRDTVAGWPFARVAALAARQKPDLVIHVGDYYYRERPCPPGVRTCAGSPYGDRWSTWQAELFDPGAPLLAVAPFVFVRGNHEICARGGAGWFRLLDAGAQPRACPRGAVVRSDPFTVDIGGVKLAILDSADIDDDKSQPELAAAFAQDLARVLPADRPVWLVTHRPFWGLSHSGLSVGADWGSVNLRAAASAHGLSGVSLLLSGHIHNFTSLDFGPARPPQLIVGSGGDVMDPRDRPRPKVLQLTVGGLPTRALTFGAFGYLVLDRKGPAWEGVFRDTDDRVVATCRILGASLTCAPVGQREPG